MVPTGTPTRIDGSPGIARAILEPTNGGESTDSGICFRLVIPAKAGIHFFRLRKRDSGLSPKWREE
jgi:hypothetical protein